MPLDLTQQAGFGTAARSVLAAAAVALFFTNADSYAFAVNAAPAPVVLVMVFAGITLLLVLADPHRPVRLLASPLAVWIAFFFVVTTTWALWIAHHPAATQELYDRYRSIVTLATFAVIFDDPRARRVGVIAVATGIVVASLVNVAESLSLVTFAEIRDLERVPGRAAGLYINPNHAGFAIALGIAAVAEQIPKAWRVPLLLIGIIGITVTFSRGAMLCLALAFLWLTWRRALGGWQVVLLTIGAAFLLAYALGYAQSHELLTENTASRLTLNRQDDSGRIWLARKALGMFVNEPLLGNGLASTTRWDHPSEMSHNMFAALAADHGVVGLIVFPALALALSVRNRAGACFALALMAAGLFSHDLLHDRVLLLLMGLVVAHPSSNRERAMAPGEGALAS
jgi:hypothetical protein